MLHPRVVLEEHPVVVNIVEVLPDAGSWGLALGVGLAGLVTEPPRPQPGSAPDRQQAGHSAVEHGDWRAELGSGIKHLRAGRQGGGNNTKCNFTIN